MRLFPLMALILTCAFLISCAPSTRYVDPAKDMNQVTASIDEADFENAAGAMVAKMLNSGALNRQGGGRYVLAISKIANDTMQRIDTDLLIKRIRIDLLGSGKVVVTTAVKAGGPEDSLSMEARELRKSEEFKQSTVAAKGQMIAPDLSLSGKILQRNTSDGGSSQRVDYYFMLTVTDIKTGLAFWEGQEVVKKVTSNKSAAW